MKGNAYSISRCQIVRAVLLLAFSSVFTGCMEEETTVTIHRDGSGTIQKHVLVLNSTKDRIKEFLETSFPLPKDNSPAADNKSDKKPEPWPLLPDDYLKTAKENASTFGTNVRFASGQKFSTSTGQGYDVVYSFDNISNVELKYLRDFSGKNPGRAIKFNFDPQTPGELKILMPAREMLEGFAAAPWWKSDPMWKGKAPAQDPKQQQSMEKLFQGFKSRVVLVFDGNITNTNASHRDANSIVLDSQEWDKLLANRPLAEWFFNQQPKTVLQAHTFYSKAPGVTLELEPEVVVQWK